MRIKVEGETLLGSCFKALAPSMRVNADCVNVELKYSEMIPKAMDSLDLVEAVMAIEEIFGTDLPDGDAENFDSPREIVDWLEPHLSNRRPNNAALTLLRKLSKAPNDPELADRPHRPYPRRRISPTT